MGGEAVTDAHHIEFQKEGHIYRVNGKEVPSVTQILNEVGLMDTRWYNRPDYRIKGQIVHELTAMLDKGYLAHEDLADTAYEAYRGYIEAWEQYKADFVQKIFEIEKRVCNIHHGYAGTLDRECSEDKAINAIHSIIDIKTGQPDKWHGAQLVGYRNCIDEDSMLLKAVYLQDNGRYKVKTYGGAKDHNLWNAALIIYRATHE